MCPDRKGQGQGLRWPSPVGAGRSRAETTEGAMALLDWVGLADRRDACPARLSGGRQQRVAIARALAMRPKLMLCDEPTSALGPELVGEVLDVMRAVAADGVTALVVTHALSLAREVADELVFFDDGLVPEAWWASYPRRSEFGGRVGRLPSLHRSPSRHGERDELASLDSKAGTGL
ncbi:amino acid ABC transporter ATP-binding protein [Streptomyces sp. MBT65]|nr:amino acid ABC transporter ATP-binding protein [Streptomyces sp. MBT65]